jgi:hypothetical protein
MNGPSRCILLGLLFLGISSQISQTTGFRPTKSILVNEDCKFYQIPTFNLDTSSANPLYMNLTLDTVSLKQNFTSWDLESWGLYNASCFQVSYNKSTTENITNIVSDNNLNAPFALVLNFKIRGNQDTYAYVYPVVANLSLTPTEAIREILNWTQTFSNANGTIGYLDGPARYVAIVREVQGFSIAGTSQVTSCPPANTLIAEKTSVYRFNCLLNENRVYAEYQYLTVTHSFPFWLLFFAIFTFIIFTNYIDEDVEIRDERRTSIWMHYPLYTICMVAHYTIYPRRMRVSIVYLVCAAIYWFNAVVIFRYVDNMGQSTLSLGVRLGAITVASAAFGLIFEFIAGLFVVYYYKTNRDFLTFYTQSDDYEQKKHILEAYEERNFQATHIFYFFFIIIGLFFLIIPIYFLYWWSTDDQAWWLLMGVIGIAMKYFFFDFILMGLARVGCGAWPTWMRGFAYDHDSYEKWESIKKYI